MRAPDINLAEIEQLKKDNFMERLKFIDMYVAWVKKQPNKV